MFVFMTKIDNDRSNLQYKYNNNYYEIVFVKLIDICHFRSDYLARKESAFITMDVGVQTYTVKNRELITGFFPWRQGINPSTPRDL